MYQMTQTRLIELAWNNNNLSKINRYNNVVYPLVGVALQPLSTDPTRFQCNMYYDKDSVGSPSKVKDVSETKCYSVSNEVNDVTPGLAQPNVA